jgi:hypothetical protein
MADRWYIQLNGSIRGPVDLEDLLFLAESGALTSETPVQREGVQEWETANHIPGLFADTVVENVEPQSRDPLPVKTTKFLRNKGGQSSYRGNAPHDRRVARQLRNKLPTARARLNGDYSQIQSSPWVRLI